MPEANPNPRTADDDSLIQGRNWFSRKIEAFIINRTPKCTEMTHLLSEEMDHPLTWFMRFKMRVHFLTCCYCRRYKENLQYLRNILRSSDPISDDVSGPQLPIEAKVRLKQVLRDQLNSH